MGDASLSGTRWIGATGLCPGTEYRLLLSGYGAWWSTVRKHVSVCRSSMCFLSRNNPKAARQQPPGNRAASGRRTGSIVRNIDGMMQPVCSWPTPQTRPQDLWWHPSFLFFFFILFWAARVCNAHTVMQFSEASIRSWNVNMTPSDQRHGVDALMTCTKAT